MKRAVIVVAVFGGLGLLAACHGSEPAWTHAADAKPGEPTLAGEPLGVRQFAAPPVIDGKLDEPAWAQAAALGPLVDPLSGAPAKDDHPVAALARLGWDAQKLYLGIVVRDKKPESPFARDEVDPHVWARASGIELMLQPGDPGDNRDYDELQIDVNGAVWDTHFDDYNQPITGQGQERRFGHQEWVSQVERAVTVDRGRYYAIEAALPWAAIAGAGGAGSARVPVPPRPGDVWRLNLYTFRDGQRRALAWSPTRGQGNFHKASRFGRVRFQ